MKRRKRWLTLCCICGMLLGACQTPGNDTAPAETVGEIVRTETSEELENAAVMYTPGTYEATKTGHHGDITVSMTFSENEILNCAVTANTDTNLISQPAVDTMTANAVKYQTVKVDSVAGATLSSAAIRLAMEDCAKQAGADVSAMEQMDEAAGLAHEDEEYDVVIVGAGTSGVTAALAASTAEDGKSESGLNILLIEKLAFGGGSFIVSGAGIFDCYGTEQHASGEFDTTDEDTFVDYLYNRSGNDYLGLQNEALQRLVYRGIHPAEALLREAGMPFSETELYYCEPMDVRFEKHNDNSFADVLAWAPVYDELEEAFVKEHGYASVADIVGQQFLDVVKTRSNIELRVSTKAVGLVVEGGAVTGVKVEQTDLTNNTVSTYTIHAKKVILATGSPNLNTELLAQYDDDFANAWPFCAAGQTGDGIIMMQEAGLNPVIQGTGGMCYNGTDYQFAMEDGLALTDMGYPVLNLNGDRFYDEGSTAPYDTGRNTMLQEKNTAYTIYDSRSEFLNGNKLSSQIWYVEEGENLYDFMVRRGWAVKADTLEELAQMINLDPDKFVAAIQDFNRAAAGEIEDELCAIPERMQPVTEAPYYALTVHAFRIESYISLKTAEGSTQLVNTSGDPIENLYGCGTLVVSNIYYDNYFNFCGGLTTGLSLGYVAGNEVRDALTR